jgi:rod shape-determining protein MreD
MILPPGHQQLLLPANPWFIVATILVGMLLNMTPAMGLWGNAPWAPDFLLLALMFWSIHQPRRVGIGWAFFLGLLNDVQQTTLLGQNALKYALIAYLSVAIHRRVLQFSSYLQALHLLPVLFASCILTVSLRWFFGGNIIHWSYWASPFIEAALWVPVSYLLLAPQRRAPDPDVTRPL